MITIAMNFCNITDLNSLDWSNENEDWPSSLNEKFQVFWHVDGLPGQRCGTRWVWLRPGISRGPTRPWWRWRRRWRCFATGNTKQFLERKFIKNRKKYNDYLHHMKWRKFVQNWNASIFYSSQSFNLKTKHITDLYTHNLWVIWF